MINNDAVCRQKKTSIGVRRGCINKIMKRRDEYCDEKMRRDEAERSK